MASLTISVCTDCTAAAHRSIGALAEGLSRSAAPEGLLDRFPCLFERDLTGAFGLSEKFGDVIFAGRRCSAAPGAGNGLLPLQPSEQFREFVTALSVQADGEVIEVHGWPILSFVSRIPNVTEAEAPKKGLGGGFPDDQSGEAA